MLSECSFWILLSCKEASQASKEQSAGPHPQDLWLFDLVLREVRSMLRHFVLEFWSAVSLHALKSPVLMAFATCASRWNSSTRHLPAAGLGDNGRFRGTFSPTDTLSDRFAVLANEVTRFWTELRNAYIQIALMGTNFCTSAKKAFFLILRNAFRFGTVAILGVTELKQTWVSFMFFGGEVGQNEIYDDIMTLRN